MTIYQIIIGNTFSDMTRSVLVASEEPLDVNNINIRAIAGLTLKQNWADGGDEQFVLAVYVPPLRSNAWDEQGESEIREIREKYFKTKEV